MTKTTKWLDLLINGKSRKAEAMKENDQYVVVVPAAELVDGSGTGEQSPAVQGHRAVFDKDGVLLGVDALGWNAEGGFYNTNWPTKADSIYNANAAKTYAPQVFKQVKKNGGWLQAYKNGGITQEQEQMQQLLALVDAAYGELQQQKPGRSLQYLLQLMQDPQGAQMLEVLKTQVPEVQDVLDHIEQASLTSAFKKGGCVKSKASKKVKKGAKGCVPCKRLMKIGGKLVNVLTDCEGNIISKHQAGGWLIPKGEEGLTATQRAMLNTSHDLNWAKSQAASVTTKTGKVGDRYYLGDDGKTLYRAGADQGLDGNYFWKGTSLGDITTMTPEQLQAYGITKNGDTYTTGGTKKTDGTWTAGTQTLGKLASLGNAYDETTTGAASQQYYDGTDWYNMNAVQDASGNWVWQKGNKAVLGDFNDDDMRTGLTKADLAAGTITRNQATAAGIDISQFQKDPISKRGITVDGGNELLGTTGELDADKYLEMKGARGVYQNERNLYRKELRKLRSEKRFGYKNAWQSRQDKDADGKLNTANDKKNSDVTEKFTTAKSNLRQNFSNQAAHNVDAIFNKWNRISAGSYSPSQSTNGNDSTNLEIIEGKGTTNTSGSQDGNLEVLTAKKAGGYLNKFN